MNKSIRTTFVLLLSVLLWSCGGTESHKEHEAAEHEEHSHETGGLSLDHGKKWTANPETTEGVKNMINLMENFKDTEDPKAYGRLSENLQTQFKFIFEECTMKGESHENLHSFLLPMKKVFQNLSSGDLATCKSSFATMKKHLGEYDKFFE